METFVESVVNLQDATSVCECLLSGARANRTAPGRKGSIDQIESPGTLIATGDLHDNPMHMERLLQVSGLAEGAEAPRHAAPVHLVLHEIIHPDRLINGMDFSYRVLARVAALKTEHPDRVHMLLGNHELAQMMNTAIVKDGVRSVDAFRAGLDYVFGSETERVEEAINEFIRSLPIGLRCVTPRGHLLVTHSLPPPAAMARFDPSILFRELTREDYEPRTGSAHLMTWGRGYDAELLEDLVECWGVNVFILGHEKVESGIRYVPPNAIVLNSDHERGVYLPIDLETWTSIDDLLEQAVPLGF
ncbi:MAG: metallophosphoesterase [Phycisphaerales bacterium]|nr:MAG: metallophosphoesterase [Phycisphaerales bacterium]